MRIVFFYFLSILFVNSGFSQRSNNLVSAPLNGGGNLRLSSNGDVTNTRFEDRLLANGISSNGLDQLLGLNTIRNNYSGRVKDYKGRRVLAANLRENTSDVIDNKWSEIKFTDKNKISSFQGQYNTVTDKIIVNHNGEIYEIAKTKNLEIEFVKQNKIYVAKSYKDNKGKERISYYLKQKDLKNVDLYKKEDLTVLNKNNKLSFYAKETFYIEKDSELVKLSSNKRIIRKNYPNLSKDIIIFIKKNKIKENREDLVKLAKYINTL